MAFVLPQLLMSLTCALRKHKSAVFGPNNAIQTSNELFTQACLHFFTFCTGLLQDVPSKDAWGSRLGLVNTASRLNVFPRDNPQWRQQLSRIAKLASDSIKTEPDSGMLVFHPVLELCSSFSHRCSLCCVCAPSSHCSYPSGFRSGRGYSSQLSSAHYLGEK